ncbi:MAG: ArgR family transcriptional regulator [Coriobacteriales bacterium]|jgi:transcriptional regulator of arginine metabolism|nr:ArgR family transcriptional regulator [Coriobacteriales bacterium]
MRQRNARHEAIREIVRSRYIHTQRDLVEELATRGFVCTQATISRDISDMGLRKLTEGVYILAEDVHLQRIVSDLVLDVVLANNLVVVKTETGSAQAVAAALDAADLPLLLGSIAGDDTILIIAQDEERAKAFKAAVNKLKVQ